MRSRRREMLVNSCEQHQIGHRLGVNGLGPIVRQPEPAEVIVRLCGASAVCDRHGDPRVARLQWRTLGGIQLRHA